jgi:hypothetical protein
MQKRLEAMLAGTVIAADVMRSLLHEVDGGCMAIYASVAAGVGAGD